MAKPGGGHDCESTGFGVPHGFMVLLTALPAVWLKRRWRHGRGINPGLCLRCGYDLHGSKHSGRCPGRSRHVLV